MNQNIKTSVGVAVIIILAVTAGVFVWMAQKNNPIETEVSAVKVDPIKNKKPDQTACTMEAKLCADGTYVSRSGPNCEFAACQDEEPVTNISNWKNYRNDKYGFSLTFPERWKNYRIIESPGDDISRPETHEILTFYLKTTPQALLYGREEYESIFSIYIYPLGWWEENIELFDGAAYLKNREHALGNDRGIYISKNNKYSLAFFGGHDDTGFLGFPELAPGQTRYEGPYYDVHNLIIPSFKFTN